MNSFDMFSRGRKPRPGQTGPPRPAKVPPLAARQEGAGPAMPFAAGVPLGAIVQRKIVEGPELVMVSSPRSTVAERYRALVARLEQLVLPNGRSPQIILVTSAVPAEGKTTTAVNLALAMAERRDRSTLLLDADLRRPAVSRYLSPQPKIGLSEVLSGGAPIEHAILEVKEVRLSVIPSGAPNPQPLELLRSDYLGTLLADLRRRYDRIIIDTPPAVPFADAGVVNTRADGALVVIRAGQTPKPMIDRAFECLDGGMILGAVLNDVKLTPVDRYYYRYDDYDPERYSNRPGRA